MATASATAVSREILEDRWACATHVRELDDEWSKPMERLDRALRELQAAVTRREWTGTVDPTPDRPDLDGSGEVHHLVHEAVRQTMLDEIEKRGMAR